ncbi:MAG: DUF2723 domain-containing protein [Kiritimatiellaeota bacterium]|nr:DUF2723 domain-containing protein [Kiritimatiellota bacterium]
MSTSFPALENNTRHFFKWEDWLAAALAFLFSGAFFLYHMAPEVTLQDSGELVTGAFTFGVPHPPGYPLWAFLGYVWSHFIVFWGPPAWRICAMSAFTGAMTVGIMTIMMTRSIRILLHSIPWGQEISESFRHWTALCVGTSSALLFGFNRGVWLWASVSEMRVLNAFSFILIACLFFAWVTQPDKKGFLYAALFTYGLSMTNHQTVAIMAVALVLGTCAVGVDRFFQEREAATLSRPSRPSRLSAFQPLSLFMHSLSTFWELAIAICFSLAAVFILFAWLGTSAQLSKDLIALKSWGLDHTIDVSRLPNLLAELKAGDLDADTAKAVSAWGKFITELTLWRCFTLLGILGATLFAVVPFSLKIDRQEISGWARKAIAFIAVVILVALYWKLADDPLLYMVKETKAANAAKSVTILLYKPKMVLSLCLTLAGLALLFVFSETGWARPKQALILTLLFVGGCAFYLYMPIASATNPPMNWAYASTKEGFLHSITRGQFAAVEVADPCVEHFGLQLYIFVRGLYRQFSRPLCLFALVPLVVSTVWVVLRFVEAPRKHLWLVWTWLASVPVFMTCVALFRTATHKPMFETLLDGTVQKLPLWDGDSLAILLLWGVALATLIVMALGMWLYMDKTSRAWSIFVWVAFMVTSLGLIVIISPKVDRQEQEITLKFFAPAHGFCAMLIGYGIAMTLAFVRHASFRIAAWALCALTLALPAITYTRNWELCSMRTHDFGYQFGYRMFNPGGGYPDMEPDAILFGGTDPGRFVPTYLILCESFAKPEDRYVSRWIAESVPEEERANEIERMKNFDRRDVYIITQNALADATYMSYIRDHYDYNRPDGDNPASLERFPKWYRTIFNWSWTALDRKNTYPKKPIRIPTPDDSGKAFSQYYEEVTTGKRPNRGGIVMENGRMQITGALAVMEINGILCRNIFEWNKRDHAFYIEESYAIDWMYPYLRPAGVIMKIEPDPLPAPQRNRQTGELEGLWKEIVDKDTAYWDKLTREFRAREEFTRGEGNPVIPPSDGQKSFSKMRSAIAGLYLYRNLIPESEYAFRQAMELCPESPEACFRLANLYLNLRRYDDALALMQAYHEVDEFNDNVVAYIDTIKGLQKFDARRKELQPRLASGISDNEMLELTDIFLQLQMGGEFQQIVNRFLTNDNTPVATLYRLAQYLSSVQRFDAAHAAMKRVTERAPDNYAGWIELGIIQLMQNNAQEAYDAWRRAIELGQGAARDRLRTDPRLVPLWPQLPKPFHDLVNPSRPATPFF